MNALTISDLEQDTLGHQHLTFVVQEETYAVDTLAVREILEFGQLTQVPRMPACIRGVINLRGAVVPVIDLEASFGGSPTQVGPRTCVVILEVPTGDDLQVLGVVVDAVSEVLEIAPGDIRPAPSFGSRLRPDFIAGMVKSGSGFVVVLDVPRVLDIEELAGLAARSTS
ncbi:chemotaxis protein CheW [Pseudomonas sp. MS15a(2019)]|uniref:chemotaxis protein CheW n=1 Tax=Pseudomonas sp. MS15a(2019) TaxID=2579938 RepID=UPI001565F27D|nr:chemotaxis protein CheW [Pseudomonas sp. MS15a(2019)]NRH40703.1 purine-binding chemotaxis protein CheW [Pseudomonas sp. MS15a(2019)]